MSQKQPSLLKGEIVGKPIKDLDLKQYGIKGQKWGVRRSDAQIARAAEKRTSDLSNDELKSAVRRMNLEKQYSTLKGERTTFSKAQKAAGTVIAAGATVNAAIAFVKSPAGQAIKKGLVGTYNKVKN